MQHNGMNHHRLFHLAAVKTRDAREGLPATALVEIIQANLQTSGVIAHKYRVPLEFLHQAVIQLETQVAASARNYARLLISMKTRERTIARLRAQYAASHDDAFGKARHMAVLHELDEFFVDVAVASATYPEIGLLKNPE